MGCINSNYSNLFNGLLCSSIFGIFFSSEDTGSGRTMNSVVTELNNEMATKISNIQKENTYDDYVIDSNRAEWKDILAGLYS